MEIYTKEQMQYAISNALYDAGKLTTTLRDELTIGILKYLKEICPGQKENEFDPNCKYCRGTGVYDSGSHILMQCTFCKK